MKSYPSIIFRVLDTSVRAWPDLQLILWFLNGGFGNLFANSQLRASRISGIHEIKKSTDIGKDIDLKEKGRTVRVKEKGSKAVL